MDIRIATRKSPLALAQSQQVATLLAQHYPHLAARLQLVPMTTLGDRIVDRPLSQVGGKGLFTKELEQTLLAQTTDLAVHSLKDMATVLPEGLILGCILPRAEPGDLLVTRDGLSWQELPPKARIGTASLRRQAQLLALRPDLTCVPVRGNVDTRLQCLEAGEVEGLILATAGLQRLGREDIIQKSDAFTVEEMVPAVGQGALGLEYCAENQVIHDLLQPLHDPLTAACITAERALLRTLDGSCRTPIGGYATCPSPGQLRLQGLLADPVQLTPLVRGEIKGSIQEATHLGEELGQSLKAQLQKVRHL